MANSDSVFNGSIPEIYDEYLVPLIFDYFADDIAGRVMAAKPASVLAAGSGVVTRALAPQLASTARYVVTDLNPGMLGRAQSVQSPGDRIEWQQADALDLPFEDDSFDVVVCQFGVMFFPDIVAGYAEAARVLKKGGVLIFNVWDDLDSNEITKVVSEAVIEAFPDNPSEFLTRTPYAYNDVDQIQSELERAGVSDISIEALETITSASTARHPAIAMIHGTPLRNEIEERDSSALESVTDRATAALAARFGEGPISASIRGYVVVAR